MLLTKAITKQKHVSQPHIISYNIHNISMDSILAMNNQACLLLENGAYEASLAIFRDALALTQEILQEDGNSEMDASFRSTDSEVMLQRHTALAKVQSPRKPLHVAFDDECDVNTVFVYRSPIHISLQELDEREMDEFDLNCIMLFNMALASHVWALDEEEKCRHPIACERRLKKALKYYEMAFTLQVDLGSMNITNILALVNNCSAIYRLLERTQRAEKFCNHMLSTLMAMIEIGEAKEVEQLEGFLHNASRLILQDVAAAAA